MRVCQNSLDIFDTSPYILYYNWFAKKYGVTYFSSSGEVRYPLYPLFFSQIISVLL